MYNRGPPHSSLGPGIPNPRVYLPVTPHKHRHSIPGHLKVIAHPVLGGLHHVYFVEAKAKRISADRTQILEGEMDTIPIPGFREPFSSLSHLIGAFVFLIYGIKLIFIARVHRGWAVAVTVFVVSGVFLLSMSGMYHLLEQQGVSRAVLQRLDHAGIFALIAGTFTPVHSILFTGFWRWGFLITIWALAIAGITLKSIFFNEMAEWVGLVAYLGLGWLGILSAYLTHRLHGFAIIKPLLFGALAYTAGASVEFLRLPVVISGVIGPHELFHIAVLAGLAWHWQFIRNLLMMGKGISGDVTP